MKFDSNDNHADPVDKTNKYQQTQQFLLWNLKKLMNDDIWRMLVYTLVIVTVDTLSNTQMRGVLSAYV